MHSNGAVKNVLSFDIEDTFQYLYRNKNGKQAAPTQQVVESTMALVNILAEYKVSATFFILGIVAECFPELIANVANAGHEIATHGHSHKFVSSMSPDEFYEDVTRSLSLLSSASDYQVIGYRAPAFSITSANCKWVWERLQQAGIRYDSSVVSGRWFENKGQQNLSPFALNSDLTELPITTINYGNRSFPLGGTYFRLFPYSVIRNTVIAENASGRPAVIYLHPYEFDFYQLPTRRKDFDYSGVPLKQRVLTEVHRGVRHINRTSSRLKLERLLSEFEFTTAASLLDKSKLPLKK